MALLICPRCGKEELGQALTCRACGAALPHKTILEMPSLGNLNMDQTKCSKCQANLPPLASRCPLCGEPRSVKLSKNAVLPSPQPSLQRSTTVADRGLAQQKSPAPPQKQKTKPPSHADQADRLRAAQQIEAAERTLQSAAQSQKIQRAAISPLLDPNKKAAHPPANRAPANRSPLTSDRGEVRVQLSSPKAPAQARAISRKKVAAPVAAPVDAPMAATKMDMPAMDLSVSIPQGQKPAILNKNQATETAMQPIEAQDAFAPTLQMPAVDAKIQDKPAPKQAHVETLATLEQISPPQSSPIQASPKQASSKQAQALLPKKRSCPHCGAALTKGIKFCGQCGASVSLAQDYAETEVFPQLQQQESALFELEIFSLAAQESKVLPLLQELTTVGRSSEADICLADDPYLAPRHLQVQQQKQAIVLTPLTSTNGVFVRLQKPVQITSDTRIRIGQQILELSIDELQGQQLVANSDEHGTRLLGSPQAQQGLRLRQLFSQGMSSVSIHLGRTLSLGRDHCDLNFPLDEHVADRHARILRAGDSTIIEDLNTDSGTFSQVQDPLELHEGDEILLGQTRLSLRQKS